MGKYIRRHVDAQLKTYLDTFGAVVIEGPKWCGKTTTAASLAASQISIANPSGQFQNRRFAETDPALALDGARPRLVDEWQEVPMLWDAVRFACDEAHGAPGQFILTGSSIPRPKGRADGWGEPMHSGAGRIGRLRMSTLTLAERGLSSGAVSLAALMAGKPCSAPPSTGSLAGYADAICHGGWPANVDMSVTQSMLTARGYLDAVANADVSRVDGVRRDPEKVSLVIASLARNESTLATNKTLLADVGGRGVADSTMRDYLDVLRRVFLIQDVPAWNPALRSPVKIRAAAKHHFADVSLAAAALGATPQTLLGDLKTMGLLFESLVLHDLIAYAQTFGARVAHYRDDSDLEVDAIVAGADGSWGAFEIKLGADQENAAAASLNALERKMVARGERSPAVKAVVVGVGAFGYVRQDGVRVVPFDALGA